MKTAQIKIAILYIAHYSCPYKLRSRHPTLIFSPLVISTVNHRPPVGLYAEMLVAEYRMLKLYGNL